MSRSSLKKRLKKLYREANLPPDSLIHAPGSKIKVKGDRIFVCGGTLTKKERERHKKLDANLKRSRKRKPDFLCAMD